MGWELLWLSPEPPYPCKGHYVGLADIQDNVVK